MSRHRTFEYPFRSSARYRHVCLFGRGVKSGKDAAEENTSAIIDALDAQSKLSNNLSRARRTIYDYIMCNQFDFFCTFTFNAAKHDRYDWKQCKKLISHFFRMYKQNHSSDFKYLVVPEFHKDGAVHFHGMVKGIRTKDLVVPEFIPKRVGKGLVTMVPNTKGYVDWVNYSSSYGYFSCSAIKDYERCAVYVSKYITKDLMTVSPGQRLFLSSKGLVKPSVVEDIQDDALPLLFEPDFKNEFCAISDSNDSLGVVPDWWGEQCSELYDADRAVLELDVKKEDAIYPRLTGTQMSLYT